MTNAAKNVGDFLKRETRSNSEPKLDGLLFHGKTTNIPIELSIELSDQEKMSIRELLDNPGTPLENVSQHFEQLARITREIRCISAQSVLLHGQRIKEAQELLANYREGTFTKWLMITYGNRQTPYNMLRYYEFHKSADKEFQTIIEAAPKKCVYLLASREGDDADKLELIKEHGHSPQSNLLLLIQKTFPTQESDRRKPKPLNASTIKAMGKLCKKLESQSEYIAEDDRIEIQKLVDRLQKL